MQVDDLGVGGLLRVPEILGDHVAHAGYFGQLVADFSYGEVEVLRADEKDVVGRAVPDRSKQARNQLDQATCLLELLILLKEGDDVLETRVERVGRCNLIGNCFGTTVRGLGLGRFL